MKNFKLFFILTLIFTLSFSVLSLPVLAETEDEVNEEEIKNDAITNVTEDDTLSFVLKARWGFVRGNPLAENLNGDSESDNSTTTAVLAAKDYNGSIFTDDSSRAKITLIKKDHFESNDSIIDEENPVAWISNIYGHWDGVYVDVMAKADANITVRTTQGEITKTARQWYNLRGHAIERLGGHELLDVQTHKKDNRRQGIVVMWGRLEQGPIECITQPCPQREPVDFSGQLTMDNGSYVKLLRKLRFEENDLIEKHDRNHIAWTSQITTARDGLYTFMLPGRDISVDNGFTITLDNVAEDGWSRHYSFAEVREGQRNIITINGVDYVVIVGQKTIVNQLVKDRQNGIFYFIKNNVKHRVPNSDILRKNGLNEDDALEIDEEELEIFADGNNLTYPNGTIITEAGQTFVVADGVKRMLADGKSLQAFDRLNAIIGGQNTSSLDEGEPVESSQGLAGETLVKVPGKKAIWLVQGNKKKYFHRAQVFLKHRFNWDHVKEISQAQLDEFDFNGVVTYPDGTLVKTRDIDKVFLIDNGKLRWIETEEAFHNLGLDFNDVIDIELVELSLYGENDPVITE